MSFQVEVITRHDLALSIHLWAQDVLKTNKTCGLGKSVGGKYQVVWPGLIDQWIHAPEEHGQYLGTLDRDSTPDDVERMLEGEE
jgi:hypothetical protein